MESHTEDLIERSKEGTLAIRKCSRYAGMIFLTLHDMTLDPGYESLSAVCRVPPQNNGIKLCHIDVSLIGVIHSLSSWWFQTCLEFLPRSLGR